MILTAYRAGDPFTEHAELTERTSRPFDGATLSATPDLAAQALLGSLVVRADEHGLRVGRIVETEAYAGPEDRASHARAGRTGRTGVMFGPAGRAYVYLVYGLHHCLNVVCGAEGTAAAVLIRAVEPVTGAVLMRHRRGPTAGPEARLAAGPAKTCQALDIDRGLDGIDLLADGPLWLATDDGAAVGPERIVSGPRIGVAYAGPPWATQPWRFGIADSPSLSRPFPESR